MKQRIGFSVALVVLLSLVVFAQSASKSSVSQPPSSAAHGFSKKAVSFSGTISDDGKFFLADPDAAVWAVANPESVKAEQGQRVTMQAQTNAETSEIRVLHVKSPAGQITSMASRHDAAFRR